MRVCVSVFFFFSSPADRYITEYILLGAMRQALKAWFQLWFPVQYRSIQIVHPSPVFFFSLHILGWVCCIIIYTVYVIPGMFFALARTILFCLADKVLSWPGEGGTGLHTRPCVSLCSCMRFLTTIKASDGLGVSRCFPFHSNMRVLDVSALTRW